ncbi:unnamed protein product [Ambrosiozyma monospora]|uniref:Unnamed protein product n=1 Tax=Ambrosiozyma monospora TaxID=43982 RepID=A0ACB5TL63_AMBMO|nr:unnamed protein product [Ambrosiozyma monospora]
MLQRQLFSCSKASMRAISRPMMASSLKSAFTQRSISTSSLIYQEVKKTEPIVKSNPVPTPPIAKTTPKKKGAGFWRWTFRITMLSTIAGWSALTYLVWKETNPADQLPQTELKPNGNKRKKIVIVGSGWGAMSFLQKLDTTQYNVVIVSPRNYFLFTPLLPSVPTGTIDQKSICDPVRLIARQTPGEVQYMEAAVTDIDPEAKKVYIEHKSDRLTIGDAFINDGEPIRAELDYDYLIYSVGAKVNTFGIQGIPEYASYLKEAQDAVAVRQKLFNSVEAARLLPEGSDERKRLMTFVVCGGGPTGVELAAEVKDYIVQDLSKFIPNLEKEMNVTLIEALPNVLNMFHHKLIEYTQQVFNSQGVHLRTNTMVKKVDARNVYCTEKKADGTTEDHVIPYGTLVWAGGNAQRKITTDLAAKIPEQTSRRGLLVDEYQKLYGVEDVYALVVQA